jgi:CheY-like chemotaxis protein
VEHKEAQVLDAIERAAEKAGGLAEYLGDLAVGGKKQPARVNLNQVACHVLRVEERELAPNIRILRAVHPDLRPVMGNRAELTELLTQLAANAVEAVPGVGKVVIRTKNVHVDADFARTHPGLEAGPHVGVWIEDSGRGISRADRPRLLDPAFSTKGEGRGQGLAIAARIVKEHGGHLSVESEEGSGTMIRTYLPAAAEETQQGAATPTGLPTGTETVLLIDDEEVLLNVTKEALGILGYTVLTATSAQDGIAFAQSHDAPIHATLIDLTMPEMSGDEACPHLKAARPKMPIILCSGDPVGERIVAELDGQVDAYLQKPFKIDAMGRAIRGVLDGASTT